MKLQLVHSYFILVICFGSCKKDCQSFDLYEVDFFIDHADFQLVEPLFDTFTEQMLKREAYFSNGTTFKTLTEQVLAQDTYTERSISSKHDISIVVNAEANSIQDLSCYNFFDEANFLVLEKPATYTTRTYEVVDVQGTGVEIPAEYETRTFQRLITDSKIETLATERRFTRIAFTIPDHMTIEAYLNDQMEQQGILDCVSNVSYRVVE